MGILEGTNAPPINLFNSFLQVVFHGFELFGEQKHHGVVYMVLGSSASRWALCLASGGLNNVYP
jgi:hypothetical protein